MRGFLGLWPLDQSRGAMPCSASDPAARPRPRVLGLAAPEASERPFPRELTRVAVQPLGMRRKGAIPLPSLPRSAAPAAFPLLPFLLSPGGLAGGLARRDPGLFRLRDEVPVGPELAENPTCLHTLLEATQEAFLAFAFSETDLHAFYSLSLPTCGSWRMGLLGMSLLDVVPESPAPARVAEPPQGLHLDLALGFCPTFDGGRKLDLVAGREQLHSGDLPQADLDRVVEYLGGEVEDGVDPADTTFPRTSRRRVLPYLPGRLAGRVFWRLRVLPALLGSFLGSLVAPCPGGAGSSWDQCLRDGPTTEANFGPGSDFRRILHGHPISSSSFPSH